MKFPPALLPLLLVLLSVPWALDFLNKTTTSSMVLVNPLAETTNDHLVMKASEQHQLQRTFTLDHCYCSRTLNVSSDSVPPLLNSTTCSRDAWNRGSHQKVVAFSFFGSVNSTRNEERQYFQGIEENLALVSELYGRSWSMRVYYSLDGNNPSTMAFLCRLACANPALDLCPASSLPGNPRVNLIKMFPRNWRFLPTLDPQVDLAVFRDLDSRLSEREVAAVREWVRSDKAIHMMRDHPQHTAPVLAGMWGAKMSGGHSGRRKKWQSTWQSILKSSEAWAPRQRSQSDQQLLKKFVWPWAQHSLLQHDSYSCSDFPGSKGFPTQRTKGPGNFVGAVATKSKKHTLWKVCPKKCRRRKSWIHC